MASLITRRALAGAFTAVGIALASAPAFAQQKTVIKLGWTTADGPQDPYAVGARAFKERVEAASGGRIEVQLYPNRQLGDEKPMVEGMRLGTVDAGIITNAVHRPDRADAPAQRPAVPVCERGAGPRACSTARSARSSPPSWRTKGVKLLAWMEGGFRNMINNVRPVEKPDDVSGVKFRVMQNPVYISHVLVAGRQRRADGLGRDLHGRAARRDRRAGDPARDDRPDQISTRSRSISRSPTTPIPRFRCVMSKRAFDACRTTSRRRSSKSAVAATKAQREAAGEAAKEIVARLEKAGMKVNRDQRRQAVPRLGPERLREVQGLDRTGADEGGAGRRAVTACHRASHGHEQSRSARRRTRHRVRRRRLEAEPDRGHRRHARAASRCRW